MAIYLVLGGGLGNQMFQYAAARGIQYNLAEKIKLCTFIFEYDSYVDRNLSLNHCTFWKDGYLATERENKDVKEILNKYEQSFATRVIRHMPSGIQTLNSRYWMHRGIFRQLGGTYRFFDIRKDTDDIILYGGFQNPAYFQNIRNTIRDELQIVLQPTVNNQKVIDQIKANNSVCVHIRRGDFLNPEFRHLNVCTRDYYKIAMDEMQKRLKNPVFFVFSNSSEDLMVIKNEWKLSGNIVYVDERNSDYQELQVMSQCKHFIIANSTFSWWAQFLAESEDKLVCAPSIWDKSYVKDSKVLIDPNWIIVPV